MNHLSGQAARLQLAPEQLIERLLAGNSPPFVEAANEPDVRVPPAGSDEALAAVRCLTTLFAGVVTPDLDQALVDPMIALANADVAPAPPYSRRRGADGGRECLRDRDLHASWRYQQQHGLLVNDSQIVAVMQRERIPVVATNAGDFECVPGIAVWTPTD